MFITADVGQIPTAHEVFNFGLKYIRFVVLQSLVACYQNQKEICNLE